MQPAGWKWRPQPPIAPYIFVTTDYGETWKTASGDLPHNNGSVRVVREDPRNASMLFAGTEFGAYVSFDRGEHWSCSSRTSRRCVWTTSRFIRASTI